jgi:ABC-type thiamine transport system substrate-binding protein
MQKERAEVEQFYKGHRIEVSAWRIGDSWFTSSYIYFSEGSRNIVLTFPTSQELKIYEDAVEAGLAAGKKWIDERSSNPRH